MYNLAHSPVDSHSGIPAPDTVGTKTSEAQATATTTLGIYCTSKYCCFT